MSDSTEEPRMCPCGNCNATYRQAVLDLMNGPAAMNRDQAEARLDEVARARVDEVTE